MNLVLGWLVALTGAAIISCGVQNVSFFTEFHKALTDPVGSVIPNKVSQASTSNEPSATTSAVVSAVGSAVLV